MKSSTHAQGYWGYSYHKQALLLTALWSRRVQANSACFVTQTRVRPFEPRAYDIIGLEARETEKIFHFQVDQQALLTYTQRKAADTA